MKKILSTIVICLFFLKAESQVVSGIYRGLMEVDSPKNTINFELSLKQKKGKIYGHCYRLFINNDTVYYNLVKVSARISDSLLIVEDERSVSNNFEVSTRGIKTRFYFRLNDIKDTASVLPGEWQTSFWKNYMPLKGSITIIRENDYKSTQIYSRLNDLNLLDEDAEKAEEDRIAINKKEKKSENKQEGKQENNVGSEVAVAESKKINIQKADDRKETSIAKENVGTVAAKATDVKPVVSNQKLALQQRKAAPVQQEAFEIYEDSITMSIYDNGEIDGDTVSVFVNDVEIVTKIGLSAQAYKITIPILKNQINKVELFAENLGKIPPNTGLLVIYSGEKRYQIFFTATLEKNAIIYLDRKE
ncbi:MAG: hypothetical protein ACK55K_03360 [Bacteroidota bacterium]